MSSWLGLACDHHAVEVSSTVVCVEWIADSHHALPTAHPHHTEWVSNLPFDVVVYWINFEGKEEPAMVLPEGMTQYGGTYAGHVSCACFLFFLTFLFNVHRQQGNGFNPKAGCVDARVENIVDIVN